MNLLALILLRRDCRIGSVILAVQAFQLAEIAADAGLIAAGAGISPWARLAVSAVNAALALIVLRGVLDGVAAFLDDACLGKKARNAWRANLKARATLWVSILCFCVAEAVDSLYPELSAVIMLVYGIVGIVALPVSILALARYFGFIDHARQTMRGE